MKKNSQSVFIFLGFFAVSFLVIWYTYYLACFGHWTKQNLSVVGYWLGKEHGLRLWGWLTGTFFVSFMIFLMKLSDYHGKVVRIFTALAGFFLIIGVYIPYLPEWSDFWSNVHIAIALLAPLALLAAMISFEIWLMNEAELNMKLELRVTGICVAVSAVIFLRYMIVTSVLELYVVIACSVFLNWICLRLMILRCHKSANP